MSVIEQIIRPFDTEAVGAAPYLQPGVVGVPPALIKVGLKGGTQTFNGKITYQRNTQIGATHTETPSSSMRVNNNCGTTATLNDKKANGGAWQ